MLSIVVVVAALYLGREVLIPLALAVGLAFLLTPVVTLFERVRLGRLVSVLVTMAIFFTLLAAIGWGVTTQLMDIVVHVSDYRANIHTKIAALHAPASGKLSKATATVNDLSHELAAASSGSVARTTGKEPVAVQVAAPPRSAAEYLKSIVGPLTGVLETFGIVIIFSLFILVKREDLRNRLFRLAGSAHIHVMTRALEDASQRLGRYLWLQFVINLGYGVLFGLGVYALHIPHALLCGFVGFLMRFVPYIGSAMAATLPMALAIAIFPGWGQVGLTLALFMVLEICVANFLEPWLFGTHVGVSPLAILVTAIFWGILWGPVGLILSTPLTVCLILLGRYIPALGFLEIILEDEPGGGSVDPGGDEPSGVTGQSEEMVALPCSP